jgi:hypothetical protein
MEEDRRTPSPSEATSPYPMKAIEDVFTQKKYSA